MADQLDSTGDAKPNADMPARLAELALRSQKLWGEMLARSAAGGVERDIDPLHAGAALVEATARIMRDPFRLAERQMALWRDYMRLVEQTTRRMAGHAAEPVAEPERGDRRFKDPAWGENEGFDFLKQAYLLTARWILDQFANADGLDEKVRRKAEFYARQIVDSLAPTNFPLTNPEVMRETVETGGDNLVRGFANLLADLERGQGRLAVRMTDYQAFKVGKNVATTPGKVVFQNALMQLIQYAPTTETVYRRPLLIVPPWINKFYILDLRPSNSFIRWCVDQGHTVFVISWRNPDERLRAKSFDDYMTDGPLAALEAVAAATGEKKANVIGYCIGGTLLATMLAWMASKKDTRVASATFFTTLVDFAEAGDLGVFTDEPQIAYLEKRMAERGYLDGGDMATTFNMLRANDLIWSFVVNNYLLGKEPLPFDLLYWNADSTRLPEAMHSFYLRKMYLENKLVEPGGIAVGGVPIDLRAVRTPSYVLSTREDHIAPWKSTYAATQLYRGPVRFVLSASGHIAGVINHPDANKYAYWTNPANPPDPEAWLASAAKHEGSWWPDWAAWVARHAGKRDAKPRVPGKGTLKAIEDAPGSYVAATTDAA